MCNNCQGKGYLESWIKRDAGFKPVIQQCLVCKNAHAYTRALQERLDESYQNKVRRDVPVRGSHLSMIKGGRDE